MEETVVTHLIPAPPAHDHTAVPIYKLYGYGNTWTVADPLFCETIGAQKQLHKWHVQPHKHVGLFQILFVEVGGLIATLDGRPEPAEEGSVLLIPQLAVHEFAFRPETIGYILTLTNGLLQQVCTRFGLTLHQMTDPAIVRLWGGRQDRYALSCLHQLDEEYHSVYSPSRSPLLEATLGIILVWIHRRYHLGAAASSKPDPASRHLGRYAQLIEKHYREHHRVSWYAGQIGVTAAHLNAITQSLAGKSALRLIHERLMLEARRELIYTARPVSVISDYLGFSDPAYFTRFFTRETSASPRSFRRHEAGATPTD